MYFRYIGGVDAIGIRGYYRVYVGTWDRDKAPSRDEIGKIEDDLWKQMQQGINRPARPLVTPPEVPTWITMMGPVLTQDQATKLQQGLGAVFFMGEMRYTSSVEKQAKKNYCGFVKVDPDVFFGCDRHNN